MGIFSEWQPRYAARGVATFPVDIDAEGHKKPAVDNYEKIGSKYSQQLIFKFPDHDAFGFMCGKRSGISVLDVDTPDECVLQDALGRFGPTPFVVRSGSGHFQAWYDNGGEKRQIRPWGDLPIDILGGGYVVAPPSRGPRGAYEIIQGGLDDLGRLPRMAGLPEPKSKSSDNIPRRGVTIGERNVTLWRACMRRAPKCSSLNELLDFARSRNQEFVPPLDDAEVGKTAGSAWGYQERGENWYGREAQVRVEHDMVDKLMADPKAFMLLCILKRHHEGSEDFILAKAMAANIGWHPTCWRAARDRLVAEGIIRCVHRGGRGKHDAPRYAWSYTASRSL
jgi:hypothetical protein